MNVSRERVLILCTHSSSRSQMAEGFLRALGGTRFDVKSARDHVCDSANERCPVFPGRVTRLHWSFDDPAAATGTEHERLAAFRRTREEIEDRLRRWLDETRRDG